MDENFKITQESLVFTTKADCFYMVRKTEWVRLKRNVKRIPQPIRLLTNIAFLMFGVTITSVFSIISFSTSNNAQMWILPTLWAAGIGTAIIGIVMLILDNTHKKRTTISVDDIISDMTEWENNLHAEKQEE